MHTNDFSLVFTSVETVGLGMGLLPYEAYSLCNIWGWLLRLAYACYFGTRVAHYITFIRAGGYKSENLIGVVLLDMAFLLALALNYQLSRYYYVLRRAVRIFPQISLGNPKAFFAKAISVIAVLVWGVAVFLGVYLHNNIVTETGLERGFVVISHYVNSILVFGTFCFSIALLACAVFCLCFELQRYQKKLCNVFQRIPDVTVLHMVLQDFKVFPELICNVSASLWGVVLAWFAAGTLYMLEMAMRWPFGENGPALASAVVRTVVLVALLFLASDLASRLRNRTDDLHELIKIVMTALSSTDREAHDILNSFRIECFSVPLALRLTGTLYLSRSVFYVWGVVAGAASAGAAAVFYCVAR